MANLTVKGEIYLNTYLANGTTGYNRIGLYGSTGGAADALIDSVKTPTWTLVTGGTSLELTGTKPVFTVPADTYVKGVVLFNTTVGVTLADALAKYEYDVPQYTQYGATATIDTLTYNFELFSL